MDDIETVDAVGGGPVTQVTHDDMQVESNSESEKEMKENFGSEEKSKDSDPEPTEEEKASEAAAELGKRGGKATAEKRAAEEESKEEPAVDEGQAEEEESPSEKAIKALEEQEEDKAKRHEGQPKFDPRARVQEATRKLADERDRNRALEDRLARLEARAGGAPEPVAEAAPEKPVPQGFATYEEYVEALTDWKTDEKIKVLTEKAQKRAAIDAQTASTVDKVTRFNERITEATQADPQMLEKVDPEILEMRPTFLLPPNIPPQAENDIAQALFVSKHSAALMMHLSQNPTELRELRSLPDTAAVMLAMGALEARVTGQPTPAPTPKPAPGPVAVSQAKPPVRPISGSPQRTEEDVDDDTPLDEHIRIMNARDNRARRGR